MTKDITGYPAILRIVGKKNDDDQAVVAVMVPVPDSLEKRSDWEWRNVDLLQVREGQRPDRACVRRATSDEADA